MSWLQCQFELSPADLPIAEERLEALGCQSVTLMDAQDQPLLEPLPGEMPLWNRISVLALFPGSTDPALLRLAFLDNLDIEVIGWRHKRLEDQAWERAWMADFKPMRFGRRLWIVPSWAEPPEPEAVNLMLDPGLAFGSGTHPTTALCLEWLDAHPPRDQEVIDYGCGSGILALAALGLGARFVHGVDIDPQAIEASRQNAERNRIPADRYRFTEVDAPGMRPADLAMANILAGPLIANASQISRLVKSKGSIILSGILDEQADDVVQAYLPWFRITEQRSSKGWRLIAARRED
ncbi:MAG TPA: 50S ribosomal protein L11 methyltransferase [Gammaproteobacteria bacterium]|nr:50S ribosomal protein L11 methyltransferase [Gammaproteobacteria bacterium]